MEASLKIIGIWLTLKILKTPRQFHSILDKISQKPVIIIFNCIYHLQVRDLSLALVMAKRIAGISFSLAEEHLHASLFTPAYIKESL